MPRNPISDVVIDPALVAEDAAELAIRIDERFKGEQFKKAYQLHGRALQLVEIAKEAQWRTYRLNGSPWRMRILLFIFGALLFAALGWFINWLKISFQVNTIVEFSQLMESGINDVLFLGLFVFTIHRLERGIRRQRWSNYINRLGALANLVDILQRDFDPEKLFAANKSTKHSPKLEVADAYDMERFFDYCAELLGMIGNMAQYYGDRTNDEAVHAQAAEVETRTITFRDLIGGKATRLAIKMGPQVHPESQSSKPASSTPHTITPPPASPAVGASATA